MRREGNERNRMKDKEEEGYKRFSLFSLSLSLGREKKERKSGFDPEKN